MNTNFKIIAFDEHTKRVIISVETPTDECIAFMRTIPGRAYSFEHKTNNIPLFSLSLFYSKVQENEYILEIDPTVDTQIRTYLNRGEYLATVDSRRGRIVLEPRDRHVPTLYVNGITTWGYNTTLHDGTSYSLAISEAYKIPLLIPKHNPGIKIDYSPEVKEILEKEASTRSTLLQISQATEAPEISSEINFELRPFQKVAKKFADYVDGRAILAYDMGLGKTPIAISIAQMASRNIKKVLVVCPATLKTNWVREIRKAASQECTVLSGAAPDQLQSMAVLVPKTKYFIINYDILGRGTRDTKTKQFVSSWARLLNLGEFDLIIFDEGHYMKNVDSGRSKAGRELRSKYVLILTGTPIVNKASELWPLLNIIDPQKFSAFESFSSQWLAGDGKRVRHEEPFREMLAAYMIRRRKEDVIKDLPMIERIDHFIELSAPAYKNYQSALEGVYISLRNPDFEKEINSILAQLMRLKQIVADDTVIHSIELAKEIYEETEKKVLIFSQFVNSCHDIKSGLGDDALCITGEDSDDARYRKIDRFQSDPNVKFMVLSTKAGAEGLTLTAAHYIIFNDLCWTPKDHRQAEARCYGRMNDLHSATAYYMQAEGTVTEMIMALLREKISIIESTVEGINSSAGDNNSIISEFLKQLKGGM